MEEVTNNTTNLPCLNELPIELLSNIWRYLDTPCPSLTELRYQPCYEIVSSSTKDLKSVSLVSRGLHSSVLQILFRHACIRLDSSVNLSSCDWDAIPKVFLNFASKYGLRLEVISFTLLVETKESQNYALEPVPQTDFAAFWATLFSIVDPLRLTIIAPPAALAALTSMDMITEHMADYHMPYQALSLSYWVKTRSSFGQRLYKPDPIGVLYIRPWEELLLNERSFLRLYSQLGYPDVPAYPPSILPALASTPLPKPLSSANLDQNPATSSLPSNIRCFSYIAIFPISDHLRHLSVLFPQLHTVFFQVCPQRDRLADRWQNSNVDSMYISIERERGYMLLLDEIQSKSSADMDHEQEWALERIECGDAIIDAVWQDFVQDENLMGWVWEVGENEGTLVKI